MKNFILLSLLLLSNPFLGSSQVCTISVDPLTASICPGDSVFVSAIANLVSSNQSFNFDGGALPAGWNAGGVSTFSTPCGASQSGTPYYWAATSSAANPSLSTAAFDVSCGGLISFEMVYAVQSGGVPCEGPDEADEGVSLQYSTDGGLTWVTIVYYSPDGFEYPNNPFTSGGVLPAGNITNYTSWSTFNVPIPAAALGPNTMFQWIQESPTSGTCCDNWGLDNVTINATGTPCTSAIVNWSNGYNDTTSFWVVPASDTVLIADVYDTLGNYQCSSDPINIFIIPPSLTFNLADSASVYCQGDSSLIPISNIANGELPVSFDWSTGSTTNPTWLGSPSQDTTWHFVDVMDGCGYIYPDSIMIYVDPETLTWNLADSASIFCPSDSLQIEILNIANALLPATFAWSSGDTINPVYLGTNGADTLMQYVDITDGCGYTYSDSIKMYVNPASLTFNLIDDVMLNCPTDSAQVEVLNIANGQLPATFLWSTGSTTNPTYLGLNMVDTVWHYVDITDGCGYQYYDSVMIHLNPDEINYDLVDTVYLFCPYDSIQVEVSNIINALAPYSYDWSTGETTSSIWINAGANEQDTIQTFVTISDACPNEYLDTVTLIVNQTLSIDTVLSIPSSACDPTGAVSASVSGTTGVQYNNWTGPGTSGTYSIDGTATPQILSPGWYYFTLTDDVCEVTDSVFVDIELPPIAALSPEFSSGCTPVQVSYTNESENTDSYTWIFGDGTPNSNDVNVSHSFTTTSTVLLIAYSPEGCADTAEAYVTVIPCGCTDPSALNYNPAATSDDGSCIYPFPTVVAPNIFTPNGDFANDLYSLEVTNASDIHLTIINRWGQVVFDQDGPNPAWNGEMPNGTKAKEGTYFYKYVITGITEEVEPLQGHGYIQLVRD